MKKIKKKRYRKWCRNDGVVFIYVDENEELYEKVKGFEKRVWQNPVGMKYKRVNIDELKEKFKIRITPCFVFIEEEVKK